MKILSAQDFFIDLYILWPFFCHSWQEYWVLAFVSKVVFKKEDHFKMHESLGCLQRFQSVAICTWDLQAQTHPDVISPPKKKPPITKNRRNFCPNEAIKMPFEVLIFLKKI